MEKRIITVQDLIDDRNVTKIQVNCDNEEDIFRFIEQFCYVKDKKTNIYKPIKLSNLQKEIIKYLNNNDNIGDERLGFVSSSRKGKRKRKNKCLG